MVAKRFRYLEVLFQPRFAGRRPADSTWRPNSSFVRSCLYPVELPLFCLTTYLLLLLATMDTPEGDPHGASIFSVSGGSDGSLSYNSVPCAQISSEVCHYCVSDGKRSWDQKLSSGWMMSGQLSPALTGLMSLCIVQDYVSRQTSCCSPLYRTTLLVEAKVKQEAVFAADGRSTKFGYHWLLSFRSGPRIRRCILVDVAHVHDHSLLPVTLYRY